MFSTLRWLIAYPLRRTLPVWMSGSPHAVGVFNDDHNWIVGIHWYDLWRAFGQPLEDSRTGSHPQISAWCDAAPVAGYALAYRARAHSERSAAMASRSRLISSRSLGEAFGLHRGVKLDPVNVDRSGDEQAHARSDEPCG